MVSVQGLFWLYFAWSLSSRVLILFSFSASARPTTGTTQERGQDNICRFYKQHSLAVVMRALPTFKLGMVLKNIYCCLIPATQTLRLNKCYITSHPNPEVLKSLTACWRRAPLCTAPLE